MNDTFDFIVVGAGSAGCVLAERLSASGKYSVLVLEAGGSDRRLWIHVPIGYGLVHHDARVNWKYKTEADAGIGGRENYWPRGKVVGGSHSINAMVYIRGQAEDYEDWVGAGNPGWGYEDVLPYFRKSETNTFGASRFHGGDGPMWVSSFEAHPTSKYFLDACREIGLPFNADFNGARQEGYGSWQITTRKGWRCSTAMAFLRPAIRRAHVRLETRAHATRLLFEGRRAKGVEYSKDGGLRVAYASREVIVAGGAVNSPQLLQLSGVGPAARLRELGIPVVADMPEVGENLQDHLGFWYGFRTTQPTLNNELHSPLGKLWAGMKYLLTRTGPLSLSVNHVGAFVRTDPSMTRPNIQVYYIPATFIAAGIRNVDSFPAAGIVFSPCRPTSRGSIHIRSRDFREHPAIRPNYLSTELDVREAIDGARYVRRLARTQAMAPFIERELYPWPDERDSKALLERMRAIASTTYHPIGTCIMGVPGRSVVDQKLRVRGLAGLRVVDASIMPSMISGNTNATAIMIGERGADFLLADARSADLGHVA
jgi:choline dehydrogenase